MPDKNNLEAALFELPPSPDQQSHDDVSRPTALIHILTPEFHGFTEADFADISDEVVARATPANLQDSLYWQYVPRGRRSEPEVASFSYQTPDEGYVSVALTPEEYDTASESIAKLGERVFNKVLTQRDAALREDTGNENARARSEEDIRAANRGAVRAVMDRQDKMQQLLDIRIMPKIELIEKFIEMTKDRNHNLARGTRETVSRRFELLRTTVFDDMLDAVALQRKWSEPMTQEAKRVIQKRLYMSGSSAQRAANFKEMLLLAQSYYGYKRALILTKIQETKKYQRDRQEVVADILAVDEERRQAKEARQLQFGESEVE